MITMLFGADDRKVQKREPPLYPNMI